MAYQIKRVSLRNGTSVIIRPVQPQDAERIYDMYTRSSSRSIYMRYMRHTQPTLDEIRKIVNLDPARGSVLVAVTDSAPEQVVGYAFYVIDPGFKPYVAEPAIMIEDAYQGLGLGSELNWLLVEKSREQNVYAFEAYVASANDAIFRLVRKSGLPYVQSIDNGEHVLFVVVEPQAQAADSVNDTQNVHFRETA